MDLDKLLAELKEEISLKKAVVKELEKYPYDKHLTGVKEGIEGAINDIYRIIKRNEELNIIAEQIRRDIQKNNTKRIVLLVKNF